VAHAILSHPFHVSKYVDYDADVLGGFNRETTILVRLLGVRAVSIRAEHTAEQRYAAVSKFNDPASPVDILVTNFRLGSMGIDLQYACCRGICMSWPWNANTLMQMLCRLTRIMQKRFVIWHLYTIRGTIYDRHEAIMWRKYARQLAAESSIEGLCGTLGILVMYELIRVLFNQPTTRFLWEAFDPGQGEAAERVLLATSTIARWALANKSDVQKLPQITPIGIFAAADRLARRQAKEPGYVPDYEFMRRNADPSKWIPDQNTADPGVVEAMFAAIEKGEAEAEKLATRQQKAEEREQRMMATQQKKAQKEAAKAAKAAKPAKAHQNKRLKATQLSSEFVEDADDSEQEEGQVEQGQMVDEVDEGQGE
jgi:hypothetical protein